MLIYKNNKIIRKNNSELIYENYICESLTPKYSNQKNEIGDKFKCKVNSKESYIFYLLSIDEQKQKYNLILENNITKEGNLVTPNERGLTPWITKEDYLSVGGTEEAWENKETWANEGYNVNNNKGPITALKHLDEATKKWIYISNINETYTDLNGNYGTIKLLGKARLPKSEEINSAFQNQKTWALYNDSNDYNSYWLMESSLTYNKYSGAVHSSFSFGATTITGNCSTAAHGVRPVISVSIEHILQSESLSNDIVCLSGTKEDISKYEIGDIFTCKVNSSKSYDFYLFGKNTSQNKYNFILSENINDDGEIVYSNTKNKGLVEWISQEDYKKAEGADLEQFEDGGPCQYGNMCSMYNVGPLTALAYLNKVTKDWTNVEYINEEYKSYNYTINLTGYARLAKESEIYNYCGYPTDSSRDCPTWLTPKVYGFLILEPYHISDSEGISGFATTGSAGIRPVITVSTEKIR